MRKLGIGTILLSMLLVSCGESTADFQNSDGYCRIGGSIFESDVYGNRVFRVENGRVSRFDGFCRDPLCDHVSEFCLDSQNFWDKSLATDGEFLYICGINPDLDGLNRQIYRVRQDFSNLTLLCTYEISGATEPAIRVSDGYVWFMQGLYNEDKTSDTDQLARLMRIPADGGKTEVFLDNLDIGTKFYVGNGNIYLISDRLDIIDIKSESVTTDAARDLPGSPDTLSFLGGEIFLETIEPETLTSGGKEVKTSKKRLYKLNGAPEFIAEYREDAVFGSGEIWFCNYGFSYLGTKEMPTGRPCLVVESDFFDRENFRVMKYDTNSGKIAEIKLGGGFKDGDAVQLRAFANGCLVAYVMNPTASYENGDSELRTCVIEPRGDSLAIVSEYEGIE